MKWPNMVSSEEEGVAMTELTRLVIVMHVMCRKYLINLEDVVNYD